MSKIIIISFTVILSVINVKTQNVPGVCYCVPTGTCNTGGGGTGADGTGQLDIRIQTVKTQIIYLNLIKT